MARGVWLCCVWLPGYGSTVNQNWFLIIRPGESRDGGMKRQREREGVPLRMLGVFVLSAVRAAWKRPVGWWWWCRGISLRRLKAPMWSPGCRHYWPTQATSITVQVEVLPLVLVLSAAQWVGNHTQTHTKRAHKPSSTCTHAHTLA